MPALLVAADATDPVATGPAIAALSQVVTTALVNDRGLPDAGQPLFEIRAHDALQPGGLDGAQHRARACSAPSSP